MVDGKPHTCFFLHRVECVEQGVKIIAVFVKVTFLVVFLDQKRV